MGRRAPNLCVTTDFLYQHFVQITKIETERIPLSKAIESVVKPGPVSLFSRGKQCLLFCRLSPTLVTNIIMTWLFGKVVRFQYKGNPLMSCIPLLKAAKMVWLNNCLDCLVWGYTSIQVKLTVSFCWLSSPIPTSCKDGILKTFT